MKILVPMAGEGSRFVKEGYTFPKPLIDVNGRPMIQAVVECLGFDCEYIFLVRRSHIEEFNGLLQVLSRITNDQSQHIIVDNLTEGAACTALLAKECIDNDDDLLIANSDQIVEYEVKNFMTMKSLINVDGIVFTFNAVHPKWSFVRVDDEGFITEVAEKRPISDIATCGIYWYKKGSDFVRYAEQMISKELRVNGEFYIAPVYNELLLDNKTLIPFYVNRMWGIGTPEDLELYLSNK